MTALLDEYKKEPSGSARVQLAALKLADGSVQKLSMNLESAKRDYRDLLVSAEYPNYYKENATTRTISAKERQRLVDADWRQYDGWLRR